VRRARGYYNNSCVQMGLIFVVAVQVPLEGAVSEDSDLGTPIVISRPESKGAAAFRELAERVRQSLGLSTTGDSGSGDGS
jgi:MinD-like ATPase involved in chromosome partitioning or flagellar assembly